ncbi:4Fe-4S dicluster domain-containing protein [candidate division KSB1 bacterium]|nr:4Fe-4S dicluster domain-containing protein [candidate division KSB1 bacterium]
MEYYDKKKMSFLDRIYIKEIGRGILITSKHFFRNMWKWLTFRKGGVVILYPEEMRPDYSQNNRGRHVLVQRSDGSPRCVACKMCATNCPATCIAIVAKETDDPLIQKAPEDFEIDMSRCIFCGFCVEACPVDAIRMLEVTNDLVEYDRFRMVYDKEKLLTWHKTVSDDVVHGYNP